MLSLCTGTSRYGRREFLKIGGLTLGGLSLSSLLSTRAFAARNGMPVSDKSVIFLFLQGGPSQFETFDPKMDAPAGIRSETGEISTVIPGVTFGGTFPQLARLADKFSVVRSFTTGDGNHDIKPIVGRDTFGANMGSLYSRVVGPNDPRTGMPTNVALFPRAVVPDANDILSQFGQFWATGAMGSSCAPFMPSGDGDVQQDMRLNLPQARVDDRRSLLKQLDQLRWSRDAAGIPAMTSDLHEQAFSTILGGVVNAFDLSKEDPRIVARYDTSQISRPDNISKRWNNYKYYVDNGATLGKLLLLARRLCEAGCGFVTVTTNFVWDMHSDVNNAGVEEGFQYMGRPLDHALSAYLEDVEQRGLSDRITLVACGEMGRTPRINATGGRDHWGGLAPLFVTGGGLNMGTVIGRSSRDGSEPATEPVRIQNLVSTVLGTLLDFSQLRLATGVPNELTRTMTGWEPIAGL